MAKRSCRRTAEENRNHEIAVKLRKMTDEQLVNYIKSLEKAAYNRGLNESTSINDFIDALEVEGIKGIGKTTINKIRQFYKEENTW